MSDRILLTATQKIGIRYLQADIDRAKVALNDFLGECVREAGGDPAQGWIWQAGAEALIRPTALPDGSASQTDPPRPMSHES